MAAALDVAGARGLEAWAPGWGWPWGDVSSCRAGGSQTSGTCPGVTAKGSGAEAQQWGTWLSSRAEGLHRPRLCKNTHFVEDRP